MSEGKEKPYCPGCGRKHPETNDFEVLPDGSKICQECNEDWGSGELLKGGEDAK